MTVKILIGDVREQLREMPEESVHCVVTSPPYWGLRCYGVDGQIGQEPTLQGHVDVMVEVFREVRRVLRKDGTVWLNYGDAYAGSWGAQSRGGPPSESSTLRGNGHVGGEPKLKSLSAVQIAAHPKGTQTGSLDKTPGLKPKDLCMMPARVALALQADGWWLRSEIIWHKPNPMPESITDRPTSSHEKIYLLAKSARYYFDADAVREDVSPSQEGRIRCDVVGGVSWNERNQHSKGGTYKTRDFVGDRAESSSLALAGQSGGGTRRERKGRETLRQGADVARQDEQVTGERVTRNIRNVWTVATAPFPGAHFATFPPALIEPCIKAGTSERGCCPECGAPWVRETEQSVSFQSGSGRAGNKPKGKHEGKEQSESGDYDIRMGPVKKVETTGWAACCSCDVAPPVPCTVLDPFGGAGTTGLVADRLKRNAILIELNPEYAAMARARIQADGGMFAEVR